LALPSVDSTAGMACPSSARSHLGRPSDDNFNGFTTRRRHTNMPKVQNYESPRSIRCSVYFEGPVLQSYRVVRWYVQRHLQRWSMRRSGQAGRIPPTSISARPSASLSYRFVVLTCRARRLDDPRVICTSSLTSDDWKRGNGPNCGTGKRKSPDNGCSSGLKGTALVVDSTRRARLIVPDFDREASLVRELLQFHFPEPYARAQHTAQGGFIQS
jgi:hypothetical protein